MLPLEEVATTVIICVLETRMRLGHVLLVYVGDSILIAVRQGIFGNHRVARSVCRGSQELIVVGEAIAVIVAGGVRGLCALDADWRDAGREV